MEWIANMEGPRFLLLYATVILTTLAAAYIAIRSGSGGDRVDPLVPASPDPYEMAYLRGGDVEVAKLTLIELARRGYVQEKQTGSRRSKAVHLRQKKSHPDPANLPAPQKAIFEIVSEDDKPLRQLMRTGRFRAAIGEIKSSFLPRLEREGLIAAAARRAKVLFISIALILGLGGYKLVVALETGKLNVGFLASFAVVATVALLAIAGSRLTARGRKYFRNAQEVYRSETSDVVLDPSSAETNDMLLHVGLFGAPILFGTAASGYATMLGLDPSNRYGASGCGSACGSSCSSGGDGGGGCGGCGGD